MNLASHFTHENKNVASDQETDYIDCLTSRNTTIALFSVGKLGKRLEKGKEHLTAFDEILIDRLFGKDRSGKGANPLD